MAPEMLRPQERPITERTDIYQLGAILYQIIRGQPPHLAQTRAETVESIERSQPWFGQGEDLELVAICQRAMRRQPEVRFARVEDFAQALRDYLGHESSRSLARRAAGMALLLGQILTRKETERQEVYELFGPCRFAFQESLRGWPGNKAARVGLRDATEMVARYELAQRAPRTALNLLAEVGVDQGEIFQAAQEQMQLDREAERRAEHLRREGDRNTAIDSRRRCIVALGLGWALLALTLQLLGSSYRLLCLSNGAFLVAWIGLGIFGRHWLLSSAINRQTYGLVLSGALALFVATLGCQQLGVAVEQTHALLCLHFFGVATAFVFLVEWRMWPAALALFMAFGLAMREPSASLLSLALACGLVAANAFVVGRERR